MARTPLAVVSLLAFLAACPPTPSPTLDGGPPAPVDAGFDAGPASPFAAVRLQVFEPSCGVTGCHGGPDSSLVPGPRLDESTTADALVDVDALELADDDAGTPWKLVVAADPDASLLYRVLVEDPDGELPCTDDRPDGDITQMPQSPSSGCFYPSLGDEGIELVRAWIAGGATQ